MSSIPLGRGDVIVGVDTHKDEHVAVVIDGLGARLGELALSANPAGYDELISWADGFGAVAVFGVEGTGSYGSGLARYLRRSGLKVIEVSRPPRKGERRMSGKSDSIDAEHAAREVLAGKATATPKLADGIVEAIRLVKIARDTAVKAHTTAMITLKATLVTASDELRGELEPLTDFKLVTACAVLATNTGLADPAEAMRHVLGSLARRWLELHEEIKVHSRHLKRLTKTAAPELVAAFGIGPDIAAEMLVTAGDNSDRIRSDAALAKLCGACPIPTGSGKTNGRHRLNRGGNRQANAALYRAIVVRMRWHPPTIAYVERRTAEGLSKREIIRCLKRFLVREIYALLPAPSSSTELARGMNRLDIYRSINAMAESINGLYKSELIYNPKRGPWRTVEDVELATLTWVHWWNTKRLLEPIGNIPPVEFEQQWREKQALRSSHSPGSDEGGMNTPGKPTVSEALAEATN